MSDRNAAILLGIIIGGTGPLTWFVLSHIFGNPLCMK